MFNHSLSYITVFLSCLGFKSWQHIKSCHENVIENTILVIDVVKLALCHLVGVTHLFL